MRKQNTKTTVPLDVVPERRAKRFPPRFRPVGRFCELRFRLRLHERGFISIRFHDFETAPKPMRFGSVYTEPFSYSLRHAEVITDQRYLSKTRSNSLKSN